MGGSGNRGISISVSVGCTCGVLNECEVKVSAGYQLRDRVSFQGGNIWRGGRLDGRIVL